MDQNLEIAAQQNKTVELQRAFDMFNQVSAELTLAYTALQGKVESLTAELAVANGELRRQIEEKQALNERLSLLLDALPAGVVVLDGLGGVTAANPVAGEMFGHHILGQHWGDVVASSLEPSITVGEWQMGPRRVSVAESALDSAGGKILLVHDVTAAHQLKADLERNQRLAAMGEMAASLAHQIRTPLAAALLYTSNLGQPVLAEEARVKFADKASTQLKRLERLIQDTLLFARGESMGKDVISVADLVAEGAQTVEPLAKAAGIYFELNNLTADAVIVGSRKALFGALVSLLENALHVSPVGGKICLVATKVEYEMVKIAVVDEGPGLDEAQKSRIFEPFFTTRAHGTGLGLPIALGVARAHGGSIEVASVPGRGAEFSLQLPLAGSHEAEA